MLQGFNGITRDATLMDEIVPNLRPGDSKGKTSMFVDVREIVEQLKGRIYGTCTSGIIRLNSLDDCMHINGNARKSFESSIRERWLLSRFQWIGPDGKHAVLLPVGGKSYAAPIHLDEIESQMIQGGPHLIDKFSCQHGDEGRGFEEVNCLFAIRFDSETITVCGSILGNGALDGCKVLHCPDQFA